MTTAPGVPESEDETDTDADEVTQPVPDDALFENSAGKPLAAALYVVATPIGNLSDITLRAVEVMKAADLIFAEDTRRSRVLLSHLGILGKSVRCLDAHAPKEHIEAALSELQSGRRVALLTDAGTPAVSDPGSYLVRRCHESGIKVVPIPGPSAVTTAISASGFGDSGFWFLGFLTRKGNKRAAELARIAATPEAVVLFESPNRLAATLAELAQYVPQRKVLIARELTKKFEELRLVPASEFANCQESFRGEITLVIEPFAEAAAAGTAVPDLDERIRAALLRGAAAKEIAEGLADPPRISRRDVYRRVLEVRATLDLAEPR